MTANQNSTSNKWTVLKEKDKRVITTVPLPFNVVVTKEFMLIALFKEQGSRSAESPHLPPLWPGFDSRTWSHMWVEFVVGSCPYTYARDSVVLLRPEKITLQSPIWPETVDEEPPCGYATAKSILFNK